MTVQTFDFTPTVRAAARRRGWWSVALLLLLAAFALRAAQFWNPINGPDEQYYFLVGDRMLHGAIPYVDLWDRKPWGLFALFAGLRLLGGEGMLITKIAATLFAGATAFVITRLAERFAPLSAAILAGLFYLLMLHQLWGGDPQAPVFYNLWIACAVWLVIDTGAALDTSGDRRRVLVAMLLSGLAIQLKTNAAFEGGALGAWLVWRMIGAGAPVARTATMAVSMALLGLAPTLAVMAGYATIGHFDAWWFANVRSQLLKQGTLVAAARLRLWEFVCVIAPLIVVAGIGSLRGAGAAWRQDRALLLLWCLAGVIDALMLGGFWGRYAIPLAVPASIVAANAFALPRWGRLAFATVSLFPAIDSTVLDTIAARDDAQIAAQTAAAIPADVATRCLFIYEGPVIYYHLRHACLVSRYVFPDHLRSSAEAPAIGQDAATALRAALAHAPGTILTLDGSEWTERNRTNDAIMAAELAANYHRIARFPHIHNLRGREWVVVWRRNGLPPTVANHASPIVWLGNCQTLSPKTCRYV